MTRLRVIGGVAVLLLIAAPPVWAAVDQSKKPPEAHASGVAWAWFDTLYDVVRAERTPPPPASRIYGLASVALYESIVGGSLENRSLVGQLNELPSLPAPKRDKKYHWPTVANNALATVIRGLYPAPSQASTGLIDAREESFAAQFEAIVPGPVYSRSVGLGRDVALEVLAWAATDGLSVHNNCPYVPAPVPGAWQPTSPNPNPLQPCWGQIRTMVLESGAECAPPGPPAFSTDPASAFHAAALEVYDTGVNLTAEQKLIADYWADGAGQTGTPPGHWIAITGQIARRRALSLMAAAEAFTRVGLAVHDGFIGCWSTKYLFNLQRPVTYIRDRIDAAWTPHIGTPSFPSYHSGHSTQSGAAASVLTGMFGIVSFTDTTHTDHGLLPPLAPRTFGSFEKAAGEAAVSRLYGGIHYAFDNDDGLASGRCIGEAILARVRFKRSRRS